METLNTYKKYIWILLSLLIAYIIITSFNSVSNSYYEENNYLLNLKLMSYDNYFNSEVKLNKFIFEKEKNSDLTSNINGYFVDNTIYCFIPPSVDLENLIATFEGNMTSTKINETLQESGITKNNFSKNVKYLIKNEVGINVYTIKCIKSDIPFINIDIDNGINIESKDEYINGYMNITDNNKYSLGLYDGNIEIRGRGNTSWDSMPKKSYKIKLNTKSSLLGMEPEKDWVLIANFSDKTLIRNKLAYDLAKALNIKYAHDSELVNLSINGEYQGVYLLSEQIEVSKSRVNIETFNDNKILQEGIDRGYLLEIDARKDGKSYFETETGRSIVFKEPKEANDNQYNYIKNYINDLENILYSDDVNVRNNYRNLIDVTSFVDWFIINEVFKNNDAAMWTSVYLYKDIGEKLHIGPVWDFDIGAGNINYNNNDNPQGWWIRDSVWFEQLFKDEYFVKKVKDRFNELDDILNNIPSQIDHYVNVLSKSQEMNFIRWDILNTAVWPNPVVTGSYEGEIEYLKNWLMARIQWMKENIDSIGEF